MFDLTNVTNVIETHHLNIDNCDYNVNFDDEKNPKIFLKYYLILILIIEKKKITNFMFSFVV
jgi:hypothetical protein